MSPKTAVITGASSGIGRAFALALANEGGWNLILVARDLQKLEEVKETIQALWRSSGVNPLPEIEINSVELASGNACAALAERLRARETPVDLLINNAGVAHRGLFTAGDVPACTDMIGLHSAAPVYLCGAVLPGMQARKAGQIINVCSLLAAAPMPFYACYAASKSFLLQFTVALAQEVKPSGVRVLALCPGSTNTPGHRAYASGWKRALLPPATPEQVAASAMKALRGRAVICVPGFAHRLLFHLLCVLPAGMAAKIMYAWTGAALPATGNKTVY